MSDYENMTEYEKDINDINHIIDCNMMNNPMHNNSIHHYSEYIKPTDNNNRLYYWCCGWKLMLFHKKEFNDYKNYKLQGLHEYCKWCALCPNVCPCIVHSSCISQYSECCCFTFLPY